MPIHNLIAKLRGFYSVSEGLRGDLEELMKERVALKAGEALIRAGDKFDWMYLVEDGWVLRSRYLPGGGRQIVNFALPGDFLNYTMLMFERSEFDLIAKTDCLLWRLQTTSLREMMARHPGLAEALVWSTAHEEALLAERVVSLGRRDATERMAHVLCEIAARLALIDKHRGDVLMLPLIQEDLADILGISVIHVVRVFNRLEEAGAAEYRSRRIVLHDIEKLRRIAGFDSDYLYFSQHKDLRSPGPAK